LRVLHVIGGEDKGGATTYLLPLLSALERAHCDVRLLCLGEGSLAEKARKRGLAVTVLPMKNAHDPSILRPLRRLLSGRAPVSRAEAEQWDVVHTHGMRANLPVRLVTRGLVRSFCLFTTIHSDLRMDYASAWAVRLYPLIDRATISAVDTIVCTSDGLRTLLIERGYPAARLITIRSGLEAPNASALSAGSEEAATTRFPRPGGGLEDDPREREAAQSEPRIGTVARLVPVKDLPLLLEVAAALRRTHPKAVVVIAGDGPERDRLEAMAADSGLSGMVHFVGQVDDARPLMTGLDVYVVTSVFEGGVSLAMLEAMSVGVPVVATAAGGVAEAVVDGVTGYLADRGQARDALAAEMAKRIAGLLDDAALRVRMGAAGARRVREEFTTDRAASLTLRSYERCLAARAR
jgi:glycosyltransferase involved in cell wall biosynthesis